MGFRRKAEKGKVGKNLKSDWESLKSQAKVYGLFL